MAYRKITDSDLKGVGVLGLPDTPELSSEEMQAKFEETVRSVVIPAFNQLVSDLEQRDGEVSTTEQVRSMINQRIVDAGAGDMARDVYDADADGVVDNAAQLGGYGPEHYAKTEDVNRLTQSVKAIVVVDTLPENPDASTLYLVPKGVSV